MSNKHDNHGKVEEQAPINENDIDINELDDIENSDTEAAKNIAQEEEDEVESLRKQLADTQAQLEKEKKEYMFLMADFDNFRKRTLKEKSELIKNGGENAMRGLLPIIDDFERSLQAINESSDAMAIKEGVELIYNKFTKYLEQNGVKPIASEPGSAEVPEKSEEEYAVID